MARVLIDTNLLLRTADPISSHHTIAVGALSRLAGQGHLLCLSAQVLIEFWAVVTRPKDANGLGWSTPKANQEIQQLRASYPFLIEREEIFPHWLDLVRDQDIKGKRAHDARHAAFMAAHQLEYLLTFNGSDFATFPHVKVVDPSSVMLGTLVL
jgi:predicted nucleic acid-binding protein